jgi:hypothetical protein
MLAVACGDPEHSNRFDPQAAAEIQAKATLRGTVSLEPVGVTTPLLADVTISVTGSAAGGATTDADGTWVLGRVGPGTYAVRATRDGYADGWVSGVVVTLDDGDQEVVVPPIALGVARGEVAGQIALEGETSAGGVMVSLSGVPAASSTGALWTAAAQTDAAGMYRLSGVPSGTYVLTAAKLGFHAGTRTPVAVVGGQITGVTLLALAAEPGSLSGSVLVAGADDSSGVHVAARGTTLGGSAVALDTDTISTLVGAAPFLLSAVPAGSYNVSFAKEGWATVSVSAAVGPGVDIALPAVTLVRETGGVVGRATLAGASDSSGIQVTLTPDPTAAVTAPPPAGAAVTDASGSWRVDGLAVGHHTILYRKVPGWSDVTGGVTVVKQSVVTAGEVQLPVIPARVTGRVLLEGQAAPNLGGTQVSVEGTGPSVLTAGDGSYDLSGVPSGSRAMLFQRSGFDAQRAVVAVSPGTTVALYDVTLQISRGALTGRFTLPLLPSSAGIVVTATGPSTASALTDAGGGFTLAGLPVGAYSVVARRDPDWEPSAPVAAQVTAGGSTTIPGSPVALAPWASASVSGATVAEGLADQGGTDVTLTGTDFRGQAVLRATTTASPGGEFSFLNLLAGSYQLAVSRAGWDPPAQVGVSVQTGQAAAIGAVPLSRSRGAITGVVTLSAGAVAGFQVGADRSGAVITLSTGGTAAFSTVTDPSGAYRFDAVTVGTTYGLAATKPSYVSTPTTVTPSANATVPAPGLTLTVDAGSYGATVLLHDAVNGTAGDNATHGGTTVSLTGTAFNGTSWSAAGVSNAATGAVAVANLPPGSYQVLATNSGRTCDAIAAATVPAGGAASGGTVRCRDALAPGALALGAPQAPAGGQSGYAAGTSVTVPITTQAFDPTLPASNFRGYQIVVGSAADWASGAATIVAGQPATVTFGGLAANAANVLWARAVDWMGNAGPVATATVVTDLVAPPAPSVTTPRPVVDATTTSVTLSGSETDLNFSGYEVCLAQTAAASGCVTPAPAGCTWSTTASTFALSLVAGQKTCVWGRAFDRAGNRSGQGSLGAAGVVSDLDPPPAPVLRPSFDATLVAVRAPWVDFTATPAYADLPVGGSGWRSIAWLEVDTGAGFEPLCASTTCRGAGTWDPCGTCACQDARLLCSGTSFVGIRAALSEGSRNTVAVRAVDLAGNVGPGASQQVDADSTSDVVAATGASESTPVVRGRLVAWNSYYTGTNPTGWLRDLGTDRRADVTDPVCLVTTNVPSGYGTPVVPASDELVVFGSSNRVGIQRPGADGAWCTADDADVLVTTVPSGYTVRGVAGYGEKIAWFTDRSAPDAATVVVRHPGADGLAGTGDDVDASFAFSAVIRLSMGERALLAYVEPTGAGTADRWRVINANAAGDWTSGTSFVELASTVTKASLSADGRQLAWIETGPKLRVRAAGADGRFGTADDVDAALVVPAAFSLSTNAELAVDGTHVVALANSGTLTYLVHWWAGSDGTFGTADDVLERVVPSGASRLWPSLASSYLTYSEGGDVRGLDLSRLRWEVAPAAGLANSSAEPLALDGRGWLFYGASGAYVTARSPSGVELSSPIVYPRDVAVSGTDLLQRSGAIVRYTQPDASGSWFGPTAAVTTVYQPVDGYKPLRVGGGKALLMDPEYNHTPYAATAIRYRIAEPNGGTLATFPTTGTTFAFPGDGVRSSWATQGAITRDQAFYSCHAWASNVVYLCVLNANATTHRFDPASAPTTYRTTARLLHPTGSPRAGLPVEPLGFQVSGNRMVVSEMTPDGVYLFDAGTDGIFGTADDRGRQIGSVGLYTSEISVAGDWVAFLTDGPPTGRQVWLIRGFDGDPVPVTNHYSTKTSVVVEPSGRVFWIDNVFVPEAVFMRSP